MTHTQSSPTVVVGLGEMGGVFGRAFLKNGSPVYPALRDTSLDDLSAIIAPPELVLVAVGEADLDPALAAIPDSWKSRTGLLQNELLPRDWERHHIVDPTVAVVWFEKKPGQDVKVIIPTPVAGPSAPMVAAALQGIDIPGVAIAEDDLLFELVRKNLYILTVNIAGLMTGGTVGALWDEHENLSRDVAKDVLAIQYWLCGTDLDSERLIAGMVEAIEADPDHKAMGRSAPIRLDRALSNAATAGIAAPTLVNVRRETA
jgi:ketopantoate reductase